MTSGPKALPAPPVSAGYMGTPPEPSGGVRLLLLGRNLGLRKIAHLRREEIVRRELDAAEHFARTVRRCGALFFRNAEVVGRDQHRHGAHELHDGEKADRRVDGVVIAVVEISPVELADVFRDPAADVAALRRTVAELSRKADRLRDLAGRFGEDLPRRGFGVRVGGASGGKHLHVAVAPVKDDALVCYGYSVHDGRACRLRAEYVQAHVEEEIQVHRIKSLIERHGLQMEEYLEHLGAADPHVCGQLDQLVLVGGKIHP